MKNILINDNLKVTYFSLGKFVHARPNLLCQKNARDNIDYLINIIEANVEADIFDCNQEIYRFGLETLLTKLFHYVVIVAV